MGAGLYPPPTNANLPRGTRYYSALGATAYVGDTETRAYLATFDAEPTRLYRITLNLAVVDSDSDNTTYRGAMQSATVRARWALGTDATVSSSDLGAFFASTFTDDSTSGSGQNHDWFLGGVTAGPVAVAITLKATRSPATGTGGLGQVRILTQGGNTTSLHIEDIGAWPPP
ncbi:hypothetical protein SEA_SAFTANT_23 [Streptomyces phage Saftant]|uniref:DUF7298 domain-containing protein n=1 Tax=Streptomyces phage Saftant TaxID=2601693 RepID=A0A5J6D978_9CAUD|nr:hypothetical protein KGG95_gp23 [Streptomyces phage Saftant]QEQ94055.1 hypothetical protein SEA_SAFTANT_23 [Streptomyces phage Saftant]